MKKEKILLILLPFWAPQIPPLGMACLKSHLPRYGYRVNTADANSEVNLNNIYHQYFDAVKEYVPEARSGNFYKTGYELMRHHMLAFIHRKDIKEKDYLQVLKILIRTTYYVEADEHLVLELDQMILKFFEGLETYFLRLLEKENPDVLGISVYSDTLASSLFAFQLAKQANPGIRTVMGGGVFTTDLAVGTPNLELFLEKVDYIDKILVGEGEHLFLKYLEGQLPESQKIFTLKDIGNKVLDLSLAEIPDFTDFNLSYYPNLTAYTSRSCPFQCEFCTERQQWGKYRKKNAAKVVEELVTLYRRHGIQLFLMSDSLLNPVVTDLSSRLIEEDVSIYWDGHFRVDRFACDTEYTMLWRRGGFYRARLGIESGSQKVLDLMNKKTTIHQVKSALSNLAHAGIKTTTFWVIGFPGETEADFQQTLNLVEEMADDIFEADCSPFWYHLNTQAGDRKWVDKSMPLYPEIAKNMIMLQTWHLDVEPRREETYQRMCRFVEHLKKLGIPSPYSLQGFHKADLRWMDLHKNAVPPLVRFGKKDKQINENKNIKEWVVAQKTFTDDGAFGF
jgi:radical SAM superfamily enzyme YgiQ (UPF0313 family)